MCRSTACPPQAAYSASCRVEQPAISWQQGPGRQNGRRRRELLCALLTANQQKHFRWTTLALPD